MKKLVSLFCIVVMLVILCSCSSISGTEAKSFINNFFDAIEADDFELAETFLHPERPADLEAFINSFYEDENLEFSTIEIIEYTETSSSFYDSSVDGSTYKLKMTTSVDEKDVEIEIEIVENDNGYGIYNLFINPQY